MSKTEIIGQATPEQIQEWKAKNGGGIFKITVTDKEDKKHVCYLRKPKRKEVSAASVAARVDPFKFNETLMRQCWLGGDQEIRTDDDLFMAASGQVSDILEVAEAELEKL